MKFSGCLKAISDNSGQTGCGSASVVCEERAPLNLWIASAILGILRDLINLVKFKLPATVVGRYIRKKAERRKADPSPTFGKNGRPGFGMTLGGKEASQKRQSEDRPLRNGRLRRVSKKGRLFLSRPVHHITCWVGSCLCAGFLCCLAFVVDGGADLADNFWGHVVHVVGGLGVFVGFLEDFVFGVAAQLDVASGDYIAAFQDFGHEESPCFGWGGNRRAAVGGCQREIGMTEVGEKQVPHTAKLRRDSG